MALNETARKLEPGRIAVASHNEGKVREIAELLGPFGFDPVSAAALGLPVPEETGTTFIENAILKARVAATASGLPALADDSGLSIAALSGAPGLHSARYAEESGGFGPAMQRLHAELGPRARDAAFICALALAWPDGHTESFEGRVEGTLCWPPRGDKGFGYDPFFIARERTLTFAEMEPSEKHAISHRADAFRQLIAACL